MTNSTFKHRGALGTLVWVAAAMAITPFTLVALVMVYPAELFLKHCGNYEESQQ